jgi:hypothetical protein
MSKSEKSEANAWVDPMKAWRDWFIRSEREWSEAMTRMMKNDSVARAVGQEINAGLYRQQMMTQGMAGPLAMFNMPTRDDVIGLSDRIGRLEDAVARVEAGLVQWRASQPERKAAKPPRTRKPSRVAKSAQATKPASPREGG